MAAAGIVQPLAIGEIGLMLRQRRGVSGRGALSSQNATSPSAASSARARTLRLLKSLRIDYSFGRRNFSWQPLQPLPNSGKAALKLASSVVALTARYFA